MRRGRRAPGRWSASRSTGWPTAASTTSSAAASTATRPTPAGSSRTSSRCSTTTPSSRASTSTPGRSAARSRALPRRRRRGARLHAARAATRRRRVRRQPGRRHRGRSRALTFTWRAAEIREVLGDDEAPGVHRGLRRDRRRQLGGRDDPVAGQAARRTPPRREAALEAALARRARLLARAVGPRRSRPATTRRWPPGTGWRSRPSPRRGDCSGRSGTRPRPSRRPRRSSAGCSATDGSLRRSWKDGRAVGQGVLEDYSHLAEGLLALYETTFDERWFTIARGLADRDPRAVRRPGRRVLRHGRRPRAAHHPAQGPPGQRRAVGRRDGDDGPAAAGGVDRGGALSRAAERALGTVAPYLARYPTGVRPVARRGDVRRGRAVEVAIVGDPDERATRALLAPVWATWRPNQVARRGAARCRAGTSAIPLLHDRSPSTADRPPTSAAASSCRLPVTTRGALCRRSSPAQRPS